MREDNIRRLKAHGYDIAVDVDHGASLSSLQWQKPDGEWFEILHPCPPADIARSGGCFVMVPFANRLDGGRFMTSAGGVEVPLNRPDDGMAIHGFSRDRVWQVLEQTDSRLVLVDIFDNNENAFRYRLVQTISVRPQGIHLSLSLTNNADRPLPYGMGFHPWFRKESETWLGFDAETGFARDERGFSTAPFPAGQAPAFGASLDVSKMPWFDGHFSGWTSRRAVIEWRRRGVALEISAGNALANLHVYVPDNLPVVCVEPVSHVPDVHNRPDLTPYGDVTWLGSGEVLDGYMVLGVRAHQ